MPVKYRPKGTVGELPERKPKPVLTDNEEGCPMKDCIYRRYLGFCDYFFLEGHTRLSNHPEVTNPDEINHPCREYRPGDRRTIAPYQGFILKYDRRKDK